MESLSDQFLDGVVGWEVGDFYRRTKPVAPFLVFADAPGFKPPSFKHPTREQAESEARRLADLNPGIPYFVLGSISVSSAPNRPTATTRNLIV